MNNLDEKYMTYNKKDEVSDCGLGRVPYCDARTCWMAPGSIRIASKEKAHAIANKIALLMSGKEKCFVRVHYVQ